MAKTWSTQAPHPNWMPYAPSLSGYANDLIERRAYKAELELKGLPSFYRDYEKLLRTNSINRELNGAVSLVLLPFLEMKPSRWAAFRWLNATARQEEETFDSYLSRWEMNTPDDEKTTVQEVRRLFGM